MKDTIICVDDEQIVLDSLKEQLKRGLSDNTRVEAVESGDAALEIVDELRADGTRIPVVITDQIMPGMKGDVLLREVHQRLPRCHTILLTGQANADAVGSAVNSASLYRYIAKPWDREDLLLTVREALKSFEMGRRLEEQNAQLLELTHSLQRKSDMFFRFVPREFLKVLGIDDDYESVRLGMGIDRQMSILFADVRDFTPLCEGLTPAQCVEFVNGYLHFMEAPIERHGGFIEAVAGDGVMVMFDGGADSAVRAGIGITEGLHGFNDSRQSKGLRPIRIGIGINSGRLTLCTVGAPSRIKCGVVGDPVNLAARIESLTKVYRSAMLLSHHVVESLEQPTAYTLRQVDRVIVKGRTKPVDLFEVLEAEPQGIQEIRHRTLDRYRQATTQYYRRDFLDAGRLFAECLAADPADHNALEYLGRCSRYRTQELGDEWTGVETLDRK